MNWVLGRVARRRNTEYEIWGEIGVAKQGQIETSRDPSQTVLPLPSPQ